MFKYIDLKLDRQVEVEQEGTVDPHYSDERLPDLEYGDTESDPNE